MVNGGNSVAYTYDADGLLTKAGALAITRRAADGLITGTTLRVTADTRVYNAFGELSNYTASANGSPIWKVAYVRDANGRITRKSETIGGTTNVYTYNYDLAGRLTKAVKNATTNSYAYDGNANRLSATLAGIKSTGLDDAQDRRPATAAHHTPIPPTANCPQDRRRANHDLYLRRLRQPDRRQTPEPDRDRLRRRRGEPPRGEAGERGSEGRVPL